MAEHFVLVIGEDARVQEPPRAQPQPPPNDPVTSIEVETPPAQPQQPPNDPVAAEIEERMNPELLRAIVNGDLILLKSILGIEEEATIDIESIRVANGGNSGLRGVACGKNTALHVVAGVVENSSPLAPIYKALLFFIAFGMLGTQVGSIAGLILIYLHASQLRSFLVQATSLLFPRLSRRIAAIAAPRRDVCVPFPREAAECTQWIRQKTYDLIKKSRSTWRLKWPVVSLYKRKKYLEIAKIIYHQDNTLLNACNYAMETPLHCAAKAGKLRMVSLLVNFAREGVREDAREGTKKLKRVLRSRNQVGETALHEAARSGYSGVVQELLSADEYLDSLVDNNGILEEFVSAHESFTSSADNNGISPVEESFRVDGEELLGADENLASLVDNNGISPLYWAVTAGCLDVVDMLIAANRPLSYAGPDEQNALHAAVIRQEETIMRVILEWKPCLAAKTDKAQNTPLHYAALIGNTYAVKQLLLKDTGSVYKVNLSGSFPVHLAAEAGNVKVIKELLRMCPDVGELLDNEKRNFLHIAVEKKKIRVILLACQEGINANVINAKDMDGNTPLHLAVISSESEIFALLYQNKRVNPHIRNEAGLTPLDISASLEDHQFTYSQNPQSIIHRALLTHGALQIPRHPDQFNPVKAKADCSNQRVGKEIRNGVGVDIENESTTHENMSKSLINGAILIASATFVPIFTVPRLYRGENTSHTWINRRNVFKAFVIADVLAFMSAIVTTIWLLYSAISNFHLKYRKFHLQRCTTLLYGAINLFILTFGLGGYITIAPLSELFALLVLLVSVISFLWNIILSPKIIPFILILPYVTTELQ